MVTCILYNQNKLTALDALNVMSFMIGLENLQANLTQSDKQDLISEFARRNDMVISEIHTHLRNQDRKLDLIIELLCQILDEIHMNS